MTTACIVQARLGSTRLPAKVLLPLPNGRTVLEEVLHRCKQIAGVDVVVCAIPDTPENHIVADHVDPRVAEIVRGPEHDVLARYVKASMWVAADRILRVTSDCPLLSADECARVLSGKEARYASNNCIQPSALGWSCEAFTAEALYEAGNDATSAYDREHVGPWMSRNALPVNLMGRPFGVQLPPSLDTLEDYVNIWNLMSNGTHSDQRAA